MKNHQLEWALQKVAHQTQNPVAARPCGFDSLLEHHPSISAANSRYPHASVSLSATSRVPGKGYSGDTRAAVFPISAQI